MSGGRQPDERGRSQCASIGAMFSRRILVGLLSSVLMLAAVTAQQAAPIGESLRVQITGGAGLAQALADGGPLVPLIPPPAPKDAHFLRFRPPAKIPL